MAPGGDGGAGMPMPGTSRLLVALLCALAFAGCTASGASTGNFSLEPQRVGWYAGEEAHFVLALSPSLTRSSPQFTIDRHFAIEEIRLVEKGVSFGGDYGTRDPLDVSLRLSRDGVEADEFVLDADRPSVDVHLTLPEKLRDSEYVLELELFKVGRVKSDSFRVDLR